MGRLFCCPPKIDNAPGQHGIGSQESKVTCANWPRDGNVCNITADRHISSFWIRCCHYLPREFHFIPRAIQVEDFTLPILAEPDRTHRRR
jgi:hypothetical protein